ncbi:hypothetical protein [Helicobacter felis]|uniref:hypothetical protein n=1 Tax=Helicobacter felis TaxID=214 RepID=UPI0013158738|nr:hypothetical protein [Helicobacter felis]
MSSFCTLFCFLNQKIEVEYLSMGLGGWERRYRILASYALEGLTRIFKVPYRTKSATPLKEWRWSFSSLRASP